MNPTPSYESCNFIENLTDVDTAEEWLQDGWSLPLFMSFPAVSAFGLINNIAFLYTIYKVRRLQTSLSTFLANLSVADSCFLIVITCTLVPYYRQDILRVDPPVSSTLGCAFYDTSIFFWYFVSLALWTLISWERYLAVCKPIRHLKAKAKGKYRTIKHTVLAWMFGLLLLIIHTPYFIVKYNTLCLIWPKEDKYKYKPTSYNVCRTTVPAFHPGRDELLAICSELAYLIIGFIIFIFNMTLYVLIVRAVWRGSRKLKHNSSTTSATKNGDRVSKQLTLTLVANGVIYFILHGPSRYNSMHIVAQYLTNGDVSIWPDFGFSEFTWFGLSNGALVINAAINPWVYAIGSTYYREAFKEAFGVCFPTHCKSCRRANLGTNGNSQEWHRKQFSVNSVTMSTNLWNTVILPSNDLRHRDGSLVLWALVISWNATFTKTSHSSNGNNNHCWNEAWHQYQTRLWRRVHKGVDIFQKVIGFDHFVHCRKMSTFLDFTQSRGQDILRGRHCPLSPRVTTPLGWSTLMRCHCSCYRTQNIR